MCVCNKSECIKRQKYDTYVGVSISLVNERKKDEMMMGEKCISQIKYTKFTVWNGIEAFFCFFLSPNDTN